MAVEPAYPSDHGYEASQHMKALSGLDGLFLHLETPATPMHVGSLSLLELPANHRGDFCKSVQRHYARRLPLVPVLCRKLAAMPLQLANPAWVQADDVDMKYHVQRVVLPRPGTQAQLEECVGRLHSILLDRTRPLWMVYIIEGLQSGEAAYYTKIHHALLDGQAAVLLARVLFDVTPRGKRNATRRCQPGEPRRAPRPGHAGHGRGEARRRAIREVRAHAARDRQDPDGPAP